MKDVFEEIRQRIVDSDMSPHDLRTALEIVDEVKHDAERDE